MRGLGGPSGVRRVRSSPKKVNEDRIRAGHVVERLDDFIEGRLQIKGGIGDPDDLA